MTPSALRPSTIEALPVEVMNIILSFLSFEDLTNWRLSSKQCAKIGERHLVRDLHVMFNAKSFSNLLEISRHPTLSTFVHSIFYEELYLKDIDQIAFQAEFLEGDEFIFEDTTNPSSGTRAIISKAWTAYKRMLEEQQHMAKIGYDVSVFAQALPRFPMLKEIEINSEYDIPTDALRRAYEDTMAVSRFMLRTEENEQEGMAMRALRTVLLAATGMQPGLEDLYVHQIHWPFFTSAPLSLYLPSYANLRHLNLEFESVFFDIDEREIVEARHMELGRALRSATGLETLRLVFDDTYSSPRLVRKSHLSRVPVVWERITGDMTWPKLWSLELQGATCSEAEIMSFFTRHAGPLKSVRLINMWLTDCANGWNGVLEMMRRSLKLDQVSLGGFWGQDAYDGDNGCTLIKIDEVLGSRLSEALMGLGDISDVSNLTIEGAAESIPCPFIYFNS